MDSHKKSIAKAFSWRICATTTTMVISYIITGHLGVALSIGFFEFFAKILFYYLHERAWNSTGNKSYNNALETNPGTPNANSVPT